MTSPATIKELYMPFYLKAINDRPFNPRERERDWIHRIMLNCFIRAKDRESFEWCRKNLKPWEYYTGNGSPYLIWGNLNWSFIPMALMNDNEYAIRNVKDVFGATIDNFGHDGEGGKQGLFLVLSSYPMLKAIFETYEVSDKVRMEAYNEYVQRTKKYKNQRANPLIIDLLKTGIVNN